MTATCPPVATVSAVIADSPHRTPQRPELFRHKPQVMALLCAQGFPTAPSQHR